MTRASLLALLGFVALTSIAGGAVMAASALGTERMGLPPEVLLPPDLLQGSVFDTYLVPGLLLSVVVGGLHLAGFILLMRHHRLAPFATATAGYSVLIWIFVQMVFVPFSVLQSVYFAAGLAELGLLLLLLGLMGPVAGRNR
ncbi:hypothetical protein NFC73_06405 [Pseudarthrobacter sp. RMG13]|uniref:Uncharacterized protein n=1 Tax=Pseudarthrobacter humi TaxID=2952523 RepID=A0ABT1LNH8_9MICC|nr:hypothetical protein [Pseudarthrobacter humi]MCP8999371.1 hypothetical protein [Pseudarthrobacter humi]